MRALRIFLQVSFGLLSLVVITILLRGPTLEPGLVAMLVLFLTIILVLGPWWPSADKAQKWKLNLPTDDPRVAGVLLSACVAAYAFYRAWDAYVNPTYEFLRLDKTIFALLGRDGVSAFWIVIGLCCTGATITLYRRGKNVA